MKIKTNHVLTGLFMSVFMAVVGPLVALDGIERNKKLEPALVDAHDAMCREAVATKDASRALQVFHNNYTGNQYWAGGAKDFKEVGDFAWATIIHRIKGWGYVPQGWGEPLPSRNELSNAVVEIIAARPKLETNAPRSDYSDTKNVLYLSCEQDWRKTADTRALFAQALPDSAHMRRARRVAGDLKNE